MTGPGVSPNPLLSATSMAKLYYLEALGLWSRIDRHVGFPER